MENKDRKPKGYWQNYEHCKEEAQKYSSKSEFQKGNGSAYKKAKQNGWLDDYTWFDDLKKPSGYWNNYDHCYEEAKKYKSKVDFHKGCSSAYNVAYKNKWIYDYTWFEEKSKPNGYWDDYDHCYEEAKKYSVSTQFQRKALGAYKKAKQNGWLKDYSWFLSEFEARSAGTKGNNVKCATYEECYEEALKYTCRRDFCHYSGTAWKHAKDNGWIDDYTWFKTPCPFGRNDFVVYAYRDYENKVVYVGLTGDIDGRHSGHKCGRKKKGSKRYDTLMRYFISIGQKLPKPIIHMDGLTPNEAQYYEDWYRKAYADNGWRVLNIAPTGEGVSSIGGHPSRFVK